MFTSWRNFIYPVFPLPSTVHQIKLDGLVRDDLHYYLHIDNVDKWGDRNYYNSSRYIIAFILPDGITEWTQTERNRGL